MLLFFIFSEIRITSFKKNSAFPLKTNPVVEKTNFIETIKTYSYKPDTILNHINTILSFTIDYSEKNGEKKYLELIFNDVFLVKITDNHNKYQGKFLLEDYILNIENENLPTIAFLKKIFKLPISNSELASDLEREYFQNQNQQERTRGSSLRLEKSFYNVFNKSKKNHRLLPIPLFLEEKENSSAILEKLEKMEKDIIKAIKKNNKIYFPYFIFFKKDKKYGIHDIGKTTKFFFKTYNALINDSNEINSKDVE